MNLHRTDNGVPSFATIDAFDCPPFDLLHTDRKGDRNMHTQPPPDRYMELLAMPPIAYQLPVTFENGLQLSEVPCRCAECNSEIAIELIRGSISMAFPRVAVINAVCVCYACKLLTDYALRVYDDGRTLLLTNHGWKASINEHRSAWERLIHRVRIHLPTLFP